MLPLDILILSFFKIAKNNQILFADFKYVFMLYFRTGWKISSTQMFSEVKKLERDGNINKTNGYIKITKKGLTKIENFYNSSRDIYTPLNRFASPIFALLSVCNQDVGMDLISVWHGYASMILQEKTTQQNIVSHTTKEIFDSKYINEISSLGKISYSLVKVSKTSWDQIVKAPFVKAKKVSKLPSKYINSNFLFSLNTLAFIVLAFASIHTMDHYLLISLIEKFSWFWQANMSDIKKQVSNLIKKKLLVLDNNNQLSLTQLGRDVLMTVLHNAKYIAFTEFNRIKMLPWHFFLIGFENPRIIKDDINNLIEMSLDCKAFIEKNEKELSIPFKMYTNESVNYWANVKKVYSKLF